MSRLNIIKQPGGEAYYNLHIYIKGLSKDQFFDSCHDAIREIKEACSEINIYESSQANKNWIMKRDKEIKDRAFIEYCRTGKHPLA